MKKFLAAADTQAAILNAIPAHIALLDAQGVILAVNESWKRFAAANVLRSPSYGVGCNYFEVCDRATGDCAGEAAEAGRGLRRVLHGELREFSLEYPCHSPAEKRWFRLMVTPMREEQRAGAVVMHINITERRLAEDALRASEARLVEAQAVAKVGSWETDLTNFTVHWSAETHRIFETDPAVFVPSHEAFLALVHPEDHTAVDVAFQQSIRTLGAHAIEHRLLMPDGRIKFVEERWQVYGAEAARPLRAIGTCRDITERKVAEQRVIEALRFSEALIEASPLAIIAYRASGEGVLANVAAMHLLGAPSVDALRSQNFRQNSIWQRSGLLAAAEAALASGQPREREIRTLDSFGKEIWLHCRLIPLVYGGKTYLFGFFDDIRNRKLAEEERDRLFNLSLDLLSVAGFDGRLRQVNPAWTQCLGWTAEELTGRPMLDFIHPDDQAATLSVRAKIQQGEPSRGFENRYRCKDGSYRWLSWSVYPLADLQQVFGVAHDVTERRVTEDTLNRSQNLARMAGRLARIGAWSVDLKENRVFWSDEICAIHGMPPGHRPTVEEGINFYAPEFRSLMADEFGACVREGRPFDLELQIITPAGQRVWIRVIGEAVRNAAGEIIEVRGAFQDIAEFKVAQSLIAEQAALIDEASDAIIVRDLGHRITFWSRGAERLYGWTSAEALGRPMGELLNPTLEKFHEAIGLVLREGAWSGEIEKTTRSGTTLTLNARWTLLRDAAGQPKSILAIDTDITDRKKLEQQFLRAQRMESIGTLAGGIAHDLNNLLAPITMGVDLLKLFEPNPKSLPVIENIERSARRGADLVKQVLSFARGVDGARVAVQIRQILREVESIAANTFPKNIAVETHLPSGLWPVLADPTQLNQVVLNLGVNARDAMPAGGRLELAASNVEIDAHYAVMNRNVVAGRYVVIHVTDTGTGMPKEVIDRIFEPFFTTKELGKGTGLGLSTVLGIVRSHGGFVNVYSEVGKGSTFKVYLPAVVEGDTDAHTGEPEESLPRGNGELILVVDDETSILDITKQTLLAFGYRVVTAEDGAQAISCYALQRDEVAVVLTDMMMPVMDGPVLVAALRRINPRVRIIGASGLNAHANIARTSSAGVTDFLAKPYTAGALLVMVRQVLRDSRSRPPM